MTNSKYLRKALNISKFPSNSSLHPLETKLLESNEFPFNDFQLRKLISEKPLYFSNIRPQPNPFLPWDKSLEIEQISRAHVLILNKYPVTLGHMLLISSSWEKQSSWLTRKDFSSISIVERDLSGLWFFNSSPKAGASQPHKHFQLLPRLKDELSCPRDNWFKDKLKLRKEGSMILDKNIHVLERTRYGKSDSDEELYELYLNLCEIISLGKPENNLAPLNPYNLIFTSSWIALVRRKRESYKGFSLNALGFCGYLLATKESDIKWLLVNKPIKLLEKVV